MVYRIALPLLAACLASTALPVRAETPLPVFETRVVETVIGIDSSAEKGAFRARSRTIFSPHSQEPERRLYEVFDPHPTRDLDFTWAADDLAADRAGRITGSGRLVWRLKDSPTYDDAAIVSTFRGQMKDGKPHGTGLYANREGLIYDGQWRNGRPHGAGRLILPNGEEYAGSFRNGFAEGRGTFTETTWERFEGTFSRGLRDGAGKTTLPSGLAYESHWRLGRETPNSLRIRIAQVGAAPAIGGTDDVKMGITMDRRPKLPEDIKPKDVLLYAARTTPEGLVVEPDQRRMVNAWIGNGELSNFEYWGVNPRDGLFSIEKDYIQPAAFKFEFQNKSQQPVEVRSIAINVKESMTENKPAIDITSQFSPGCGSSFTPNFHINNFGWGKALNGRFRVGFAAGGSTGSSPPLIHVFQIGDVDQSKSINYEKTLAEAGVNIKKLNEFSKENTDEPWKKSQLPCSTKDNKVCLKELQSNPIFGKLGPFLRLNDATVYVSMRGIYEYEWIDAKGRKHSHSSPINLPVGLGLLPNQAECGAGGPPEAIRVKPIAFRLDAENYTIPVPFRRAIPPGRNANFTLPMTAAKSSNHAFEIVAKLADGREIKSPPIKLLYYNPRPLPTN